MEKEKTKNEVIEKAYRLGYEYKRTHRGCSQCALAAIYDTLNIKWVSALAQGKEARARITAASRSFK